MRKAEEIRLFLFSTRSHKGAKINTEYSGVRETSTSKQITKN
jgi:hypothetical protein